MAEVFAFLRDNGSLLYARRKGDGWQVSDRRRDAGPRGRKACIIVPGTEVLGLQAVIPARNEAQARRAAPFAVEDDVGEPIENAHVALGPKPVDPQVPRLINVASNVQMQAWLATLAAAGLQDASLVAAHSILPPGNVLVEAGALVLGRLNGRTFSMERAVGDDVFISLVENSGEVQVYGASLARALNVAPAGQGLSDEAAIYGLFASWASEQPLLDLRQGSFQVRRSVDLKGIKDWRWAGALAAVLTLAWIATLGLQTHAMNLRSAELDTRITSFVQAGWPEAGGDPQRALAQVNAGRGQAGTSFPSVLTATAVLFDGLEAVAGSELRSIRYDRQRRQLSAIVSFEGFEGADALTSAIAENGLTVRAGDARQSGNRVIAELTLEAAS